MLLKKETFTVSNFLSFARLIMALPFWFLLEDTESVNNKVIFLVLAVIAIITDFLDGYFARRNNEITELGKILDPIADKIVVGVVAIKLFFTGRIPEYFFFIVVGRDILIFLGGILISSKLGKVLPSNMLGKITITILALLLLLIILNYDQNNLVFKACYYSTILLIIVSFIAYFIRAIEFVKQKD
jgi:cardiolipin synthase